MISQESLERDCRFFKNQARAMIDQGKYEEAIDALKTIGTIAQTYCLFYVDDEIEIMLATIANATVKKNETQYAAVKGKVVFYDDYSRENVMLTAQYIDALNRMGVEYVYLTLNPLEFLSKQQFYKQLIDNPKVTICAGDGKESSLDSIGFLVRMLQIHKPEIALLHTRPEDIIGILPWYCYKEIKRYYIETADHAYWPGTKAIDYCICFRNYGYSNAIKYRGLKPEQLLLLPFYPAPVNYPLSEIPEVIPDSLKLFSGGRVTKILDRDDTFLNLIRKILNKYQNTEFYYAGGGVLDSEGRFSYIKKYIKDNHLENRFHLLGPRRDILKVTQHMDVFINTFPIGGGLMVQIAAMCGIPVVIYSKDGYCASIEEFIKSDAWSNPESTFFNEKDCEAEIEKLINNSQYRSMRGSALVDRIVKPNEFASNLELLIKYNKGVFTPQIHEGDYEIRRENNIEMDNKVFHRYYGIMLRSRLLRRKRPFRYMYTAIRFIFQSDKVYLLKTIKKYCTIHN